MAENPTRPENTNVERPAPKPDAEAGKSRAEMTREAVAMARANRLEKETGFNPAAAEAKPKPPEGTKKADPGPQERVLERRLPGS